MLNIKAKDLYRILKENYPEQFQNIGENVSLEISEFNQGFMNHVIKISLIGEDSKSQNNRISEFVGIFYNSNRYNDEKSAMFLQEVDDIAGFLRSKGLPTRVAIKNLVGNAVTQITQIQKQTENRNRYFSLFELLPGKTISWEAYTRRHLRALGMYLGKMHSGLRDFPKNELKSIANWSEYIVGDSKRMRDYLTKNRAVILQKLNLIINFEILETALVNVSSFACPYNDPDLQPQLIHCDFVRGNILFSDMKSDFIYQITGILDFEKMLYGKVEIDVARTLAFLYVDCKFKTEDEIVKYFLNEGYNTLGTIDFRQNKILLSQLENYMIYFWLRDFWKFLECNPYESLFENEHYFRTVEILKKYKII
jgi:Ser/Thr protein kinase RdoA (MazF antagonist)